MRGGEYFSGQVSNPVTEIVLTRHDNTAPLALEGMSDRKGRVAAVKVVREVLGI